MMYRKLGLGFLGLAAIVTAGCTDLPPRSAAVLEGGSGYPAAVQNYDSHKRETTVTVPAPPRRIIAYHQNNIEAAYRFSKPEYITAALGRYIRVDDEAGYADLTQIPYYGAHGIDQETAVYLQPDLILGWYSSFSGRGIWSLGTTEFWLRRSVPCYMSLQWKNGYLKETLDGEYRYILDMGRIFQQEEVAQRYVKEMQAAIEKTKEAMSRRSHKPRVMILDFYGTVISSYGNNRLPADMVRHLGGEMAALPNRPSKEEILMSDPDVIFLLYKTEPEIGIKERFLQDRTYASLRAVQQKQVYTLPLTYIYNGGFHTKDGLRILAEGLERVPEREGEEK